ncbi:hypothetical protein ACVI1I_006537 [Bradyrhizobium sp. USDA 4459]
MAYLFARSGREKLRASKFIVRFVGDIHQRGAVVGMPIEKRYAVFVDCASNGTLARCRPSKCRINALRFLVAPHRTRRLARSHKVRHLDALLKMIRFCPAER